MTIMKFRILVCLCVVWSALAVDVIHNQNSRDSRKLFGGYRITPRICKPTRTMSQTLGGPTVCMFNHECLRREGQVVGACMDGFLFGACCELPKDTTIGDLLQDELLQIENVGNNLATKGTTITMKPHTTPFLDLSPSQVSKITASLLNPGILPTAEDNEVIQVNGGEHYFTTTGVTHPVAPDTILISQSQGGNEINPGYFRPTNPPELDDLKTTLRTNDFGPNSPIVAISISNAPIEYTTTATFHRPMFRPKPSKPPDSDKYVLVPTITHETTKPNKTQEFDSIVNIVQLLNSTTTTKKPPSTSYVYSTTVTRRPGYKPTSNKPPSTSYVFSTTVPPRRTETTTKKNQPPKKTKPTNKPITSYIYSLAPSKTTMAYSPDAFVTSIKPPSTSYVYSPLPTRRPPPTSVNTHIAGPGFTVTSNTSPGPPPTVIVLAPVTEETLLPEPSSSTYQQPPRPSTASPPRKPLPINHVTINNHITQNIYSTTERPSPTVLITPKPSISSSLRPPEDFDTIEVGTSASSDDQNNFPPVRNPNLNMSSLNGINEDDITTPVFIEDDALNSQVESFVNQIIIGLQEPFQGLKEVVYNKKNSTYLNVGTTTIKPNKKQGTTTKRPQSSRPATRPTTTRPGISTVTRPSSSSRPGTSRPGTTSRRPATKRPTVTTTTKRAITTTKKTKSTKKPATKPGTLATTTQSFIDHETESVISGDSEDYRTHCGIRPLMKTGRIVGGKGATFGEFPWQVLVRESTWLGLFTKNKCGGVLISSKYVMTAAHCQPGFLASLVAVFGEFDISGDLESKRPISRNVKRVIVHRQYDAATFENDLALLELEHPVQFDAHIVPICLPKDDEDFTGRLGTVTGWGRLKYGGGVPSVLQEVQVPVMENPVCQEMFRTAGHTKVILDSFLCAGYANGQKDSCEGDSGGPLVLQRTDGRYQLAGTVSHGIKCAAPYLPGVYMRTQYFKPWITSITGVTSP